MASSSVRTSAASTPWSAPGPPGGGVDGGSGAPSSFHSLHESGRSITQCTQYNRQSACGFASLGAGVARVRPCDDCPFWAGSSPRCTALSQRTCRTSPRPTSSPPASTSRCTASASTATPARSAARGFGGAQLGFRVSGTAGPTHHLRSHGAILVRVCSDGYFPPAGTRAPMC